jgi:hypothetical protein
MQNEIEKHYFLRKSIPPRRINRKHGKQSELTPNNLLTKYAKAHRL